MNRTFYVLCCGVLLLSACHNNKSQQVQVVGNNNVPLQSSSNKLPSESMNRFRQKALDDYNKKELKYYFQSIHYPSKQFIHYMHDSLHIIVKAASDRANLDFANYNQVADSIVFTQKGIHIESIMNANP